MKKNIFIISIIVISFAFGAFVGSHNFYDTYLCTNGKYDIEWNFYKTSDALDNERQLSNATFEMLHDYYQFLDVEITTEGDTLSHHNFFNDVIMESESYAIADSIMEGNWGDFFEDW